MRVYVQMKMCPSKNWPYGCLGHKWNHLSSVQTHNIGFENAIWSTRESHTIAQWCPITPPPIRRFVLFVILSRVSCAKYIHDDLAAWIPFCCIGMRSALRLYWTHNLPLFCTLQHRFGVPFFPHLLRIYYVCTMAAHRQNGSSSSTFSIGMFTHVYEFFFLLLSVPCKQFTDVVCDESDNAQPMLNAILCCSYPDDSGSVSLYMYHTEQNRTNHSIWFACVRACVREHGRSVLYAYVCVLLTFWWWVPNGSAFYIKQFAFSVLRQPSHWMHTHDENGRRSFLIFIYLLVPIFRSWSNCWTKKKLFNHSAKSKKKFSQISNWLHRLTDSKRFCFLLHSNRIRHQIR